MLLLLELMLLDSCRILVVLVSTIEDDNIKGSTIDDDVTAKSIGTDVDDINDDDAILATLVGLVNKIASVLVTPIAVSLVDTGSGELVTEISTDDDVASETMLLLLDLMLLDCCKIVVVLVSTIEDDNIEVSTIDDDVTAKSIGTDVDDINDDDAILATLVGLVNKIASVLVTPIAVSLVDTGSDELDTENSTNDDGASATMLLLLELILLDSCKIVVVFVSTIEDDNIEGSTIDDDVTAKSIGKDVDDINDNDAILATLVGLVSKIASVLVTPTAVSLVDTGSGELVTEVSTDDDGASATMLLLLELILLDSCKIVVVFVSTIEDDNIEGSTIDDDVTAKSIGTDVDDINDDDAILATLVGLVSKIVSVLVTTTAVSLVDTLSGELVTEISTDDDGASETMLLLLELMLLDSCKIVVVLVSTIEDDNIEGSTIDDDVTGKSIGTDVDDINDDDAILATLVGLVSKIASVLVTPSVVSLVDTGSGELVTEISTDDDVASATILLLLELMLLDSCKIVVVLVSTIEDDNIESSTIDDDVTAKSIGTDVDDINDDDAILATLVGLVSKIVSVLVTPTAVSLVDTLSGELVTEISNDNDGASATMLLLLEMMLLDSCKIKVVLVSTIEDDNIEGSTIDDDVTAKSIGTDVDDINEDDAILPTLVVLVSKIASVLVTPTAVSLVDTLSGELVTEISTDDDGASATMLLLLELMLLDSCKIVVVLVSTIEDDNIEGSTIDDDVTAKSIGTDVDDINEDDAILATLVGLVSKIASVLVTPTAVSLVDTG